MQSETPSIEAGFLPAVLAALLVLGILAVYLQTASHPYIYLDDARYITGNAMVKAGLTN